jgi:Na+-driven multidrug efflux pump
LIRYNFVPPDSKWIPYIQAGVGMVYTTQFGPKAVAAVGAGMRLEGFALMLVMALSSALMPFVGQNWGADKHERAAAGVRQSIQFSVAWGVLCLIVMALSSEYLARLFSEDPVVIMDLRLFLWIVPLGYGLQGVVLLVSCPINNWT